MGQLRPHPPSPIVIIAQRVCHCIQRLRALTQPSVYWGPALVEHRQLVDYVEHFVVDPWTHSDHINDTQLTLAQAIDDSVSISHYCFFCFVCFLIFVV